MKVVLLLSAVVACVFGMDSPLCPCPQDAPAKARFCGAAGFVAKGTVTGVEPVEDKAHPNKEKLILDVNWILKDPLHTSAQQEAFPLEVYRLKDVDSACGLKDFQMNQEYVITGDFDFFDQSKRILDPCGLNMLWTEVEPDMAKKLESGELLNLECKIEPEMVKELESMLAEEEKKGE